MTAQWEVDAEIGDVLQDEYLRGNRKKPHRCVARVNDHALELRSRLSPRDDQCLRTAVENGLCAQHLPLRAAHERIKGRILEIPPR